MASYRTLLLIIRNKSQRKTFFVFERKIMMRSMIMVQRGSSVMAFTEDFI